MCRKVTASHLTVYGMITDVSDLNKFSHVVLIMYISVQLENLRIPGEIQVLEF